MARVGFGDSLNANIELTAELLNNLAPSRRDTAKRAAGAIEEAFMAMRRMGAGQPEVALGVAYAFFKIAERIAEQDQGAESEGGSLIQLLN